MKKKNNKGFTLVELLASLVILGLLAAIAAPNIIGILQRTKLNTYIEDARKLSTLAQYKFKGDSSITRPDNGRCIVMNMRYLGKSEFKNSPNGKNGYSETRSFVLIKREGTTYKYYVQLVEIVENETYSGIRTVETSLLQGDNKFNYITTNNAANVTTDFSNNTTTFANDKNNSKICDGAIVAYYID